MVCIYCGSSTKVTNSRHQKQTGQVWRRRLCMSCKAVFTTTEAVDYPKSFVIELPNKQLQPFIKEKLFLSVLKSCEHRKTALQDAIALTDTVMAKIIRAHATSVVASHEVARLINDTLQNFDHASAVQYAAYHAEYKL
jgi:transcriptional repressor NrdR